MSKEIINNKVGVGHLLTKNNASEELVEPIKVDISHIITEDDTPVDNLASEKHQRLLTSSLYSSWSLAKEGRKFLASANVGVFNAIKQSPIVPDMFISLDVEVPQDIWKKENRSYFLWEYGKPPDLVVELVSNKEGNEDTTKLNRYARMGVTTYIIYDPVKYIMSDELTVYKLQGGIYQPIPYLTEDLLPNLRLTLWQGEFEDTFDTWLRWTDSLGNLLLTGDELLEQERQEKELALEQKDIAIEQKELALQKVEQERLAKKEALEKVEQERLAKKEALEKVEQERLAKEQALSELEKLAAKLKELGIDPSSL